MRFFIATLLPSSYRKEVMKKSVAAFLIALGFILHGVSAEKRNPLMAKETLVWAGIDYSMIRLVGPSEFRVPDMIFPEMFVEIVEPLKRETVETVDVHCWRPHLAKARC